MIWIILLIIICIPLIIIGYILFSPIYLNIAHSTEKYGKRFEFSVSWHDEFFGISIIRKDEDWIWQLFFRERILKSGLLEPEKRKNLEKNIVKTVPVSKPKGKKEDIELLGKLGKFLKRFWKSFALNRLDWTCEYGLGDPAQTGKLYGWIQAIKPFIPNKRVTLDFRPEFLNLTYEGNIIISTKLFLFKLVYAFFPFIIQNIKKS